MHTRDPDFLRRDERTPEPRSPVSHGRRRIVRNCPPSARALSPRKRLSRRNQGIHPIEFSCFSQHLDRRRISFRNDKTFYNRLVFLWKIPPTRGRRSSDRRDRDCLCLRPTARVRRRGILLDLSRVRPSREPARGGFPRSLEARPRHREVLLRGDGAGRAPDSCSDRVLAVAKGRRGDPQRR